MNQTDQVYLDMLEKIMNEGNTKGDRTGTGTKSLFGEQMRFDLSKGFPLLTSKRVAFRLIVSELLWFIKGDTNIRYLLQHNNHIWDEWAFQNWIESDDYDGPDMKNFGRRLEEAKQVIKNSPVESEEARIAQVFMDQYGKEMNSFCERILQDDDFAATYGELGPVYGKQWRAWENARGEFVDQLRDVIGQIKETPDSRRMLVVAYNPGEVKSMALPPCHSLFQFYVADGKLSCQLYQRSGDFFIGIPFNIASYSLLVYLIAKECGLEVGEFIHTFGDAHIYSNHTEQVAEQLSRRKQVKELPTLWLNPEKASIFEFEMEDIRVEGYEPLPSISAPVAV